MPSGRVTFAIASKIRDIAKVKAKEYGMPVYRLVEEAVLAYRPKKSKEKKK